MIAVTYLHFMLSSFQVLLSTKCQRLVFTRLQSTHLWFATARTRSFCSTVPPIHITVLAYLKGHNRSLQVVDAFLGPTTMCDSGYTPRGWGARVPLQEND
ncbi:hypothetical protein F4820DRAFT_422055 [Hypoxylon rubiginosum]|uniref:Uncharacterized protein n=1 Tax=Hypoxylon rubiginosum TaxID=110542 RepID=A0ACB9Z1N0_9PEZI|nr:hypothetical protein F4820DRAFT_422055 [Hypoxylon rubiginosum]